MESSSLPNYIIRVKEEPSDALTIENNCDMIDEKPKLKNIQLLPFLRDSSSHALQKDEIKLESELNDVVKVVFECNDVKSNRDSLVVKKIEDDSRNSSQDTKYNNDYQTQNKIVIENKGEIKQKFVCDAAEESNLIFDCNLVKKNEKNHACEVCGKKYTTKKYLKIHIDSIHNGIKHECDICGKKLSRKFLLKVHIDATHKGIKHACKVCGKKFVYSNDLKKHIDTAHNGNTHSCNICGKTFSSKSNLIRHTESLHHGITYSCDLCEKKFTTKYNLRMHIDASHNEDVHACALCGMIFKCKNYLKRHINRNHNGQISM